MLEVVTSVPPTVPLLLPVVPAVSFDPVLPTTPLETVPLPDAPTTAVTVGSCCGAVWLATVCPSPEATVAESPLVVGCGSDDAEKNS